MPITSVTSDKDALTIIVVGDYPVPVERLWQAYTDPRQLERFWGPVEWPATFTEHDFRVGGRAKYHMTGPDGSQPKGWWGFLAVDPLRSFEVEDGFADENGNPSEDMPVGRMVFEFQPTSSGSRVRVVSHHPSLEAMEQVIQMGMIEGMQSAMGQLDAVLAESGAVSAA